MKIDSTLRICSLYGTNRVASRGGEGLAYEQSVELLAQLEHRVLEAVVVLVAEEASREQPQHAEFADVRRCESALEHQQRVRHVQLRHQAVHGNQLVLRVVDGRMYIYAYQHTSENTCTTS